MKKFLSLVLALILCVSVMTLAVSAAETGSISATSVDAKRGETVTVNVSINSNPGMAYLQLTPSYDTNALTLNSMTGSGLSWTIGTSAVFYAISNTDYTGQILQLTFTVKDDAAEGDYPISFYYQAWTEKEEAVSFGVGSGTVKVTIPHDHDWATEWSKNEESHWHACKNGCDETKDLAGHTYGDWIIDSDATCGTAGAQHRECSACGYVENATIPATGEHSYPWVKEDDTNHKGTCSCGDTKTEEHKWNDGEVTTEPTCKDAGVKTYTCTKNCGATKTEEIEATGEHNYTKIEKIEDDLKDHKVFCDCGEFQTVEHDWKPGIVTKPATCGADGEQPYSCVCGATKTDVLTATGKHDHTDEYKDNEDGKTHTAYCTCGDAKTEDHNYSINGKVTVTPTKTSEGKQEMLCVCGAKTVKTLPKISADLDDVPKTGDITPHIVLTITAVMALLAAAFVCKRKFAN